MVAGVQGLAIGNGQRFRVYSSDGSVTVVQTGGIVDLSVAGGPVLDDYVRRDGTTTLTRPWNVGAQLIGNIADLAVNPDGYVYFGSAQLPQENTYREGQVDGALVLERRTTESWQPVRTVPAGGNVVVYGGPLGTGGAVPTTDEALRAKGPEGVALLYDVDDDDMDKAGRWGIRARVVSQLPFLGIVHEAQADANLLTIGGGTSLGQAATAIQFRTAAGVNTATGTLRWTILSDGRLVPSTTHDIGAPDGRCGTVWASEIDASVTMQLPVLTDGTRGAAGTAGRVIFNADDGNLNIDNGIDWILPDGTIT